MRKINFQSHILPHLVAVLVFLIVTITFFKPIFFENKILNQHDIQQFLGASKELTDYKNKTGEEGLWAQSMFSGMPAYLVHIGWDDGVLKWTKSAMTLFLPHPIRNIFLALLCYYILLLTFKVRPYLAIAGALAFGLSSYMIIGLSAGHNSRIGAIAFVPLVVAGIHLAFSRYRVLGFGLTTLGLGLHLQENHLQITYYLIFIVAAYGLIMLWFAFRDKQLKPFFKTLGILVPAVIIAGGTFFGQMWSIMEYSHYSIRGPSELMNKTQNSDAEGLSKAYAFEYSYGILEPMTLLIPNFFGGSTSQFLASDENSNTYRQLVSSADNKTANQLAGYSTAYWGPQFNTAPYYAGAIFVMLFIVGIFFADRKYVYWLVPLSILSIMITWGDSFETFSYFLFDYFPGYNKFRSVTFGLIIILFAIPLLGMLGLENLLKLGWEKIPKKKVMWLIAVVPIFCVVLALLSGFMSFTKPEESELPVWLRMAMVKDRRNLFFGDVWRSLGYSFVFGVVLLATLRNWIKEAVFVIILIILTLFDDLLVDRRFLSENNFVRKRGNIFSPTKADILIQNDSSSHRVFNIENTMAEARTSYFHHSLGGYHGAKLRRYMDFYDSCIYPQTQKLVESSKETNNELNFQPATAINMLNVKYLIYNQANGYIENSFANGPAWFAPKLEIVNSPTEELKNTSELENSTIAVIDGSKFKVDNNLIYDSTATIQLLDEKPYWQKFESRSSQRGIAVFSEIYYPKWWYASIDGKEAPLLRANYILRALEIPEGKHTIEFVFKPKPYIIGNQITKASSGILLLVVLLSLGVSLYGKKKSEDDMISSTKPEVN